jgi:Ca-activated chloride channel family protein
MNEPIDSTLKNLQPPAPDPQARMRAKRAALAEFARVQAATALPGATAANAAPNKLRQALARWLRLSRDTTHGSTSMKLFANRGLLAGAAGVGVLAIGLATVLPNLERYDAELSGPDFRLPATQATPDTPPAPESINERVTEPAVHPEHRDMQALPTDPAPQADSVAQAEAKGRELLEYRKRESLASGEAEHAVHSAEADKNSPLVFRPTVAPAPPPPSVLEPGNVVVTGARANSRQLVAKVQGGVASDSLSMPSGPVLDEGRDQFEHFDLNPIRRVSEDPVSTFSADVDTASYSFVRSQIDGGHLPQKDAVRVEEMVNYFDYAWPAASSRKTPFKPTVVVSDSPWGKSKKLVHIGIKGYELDREQVPDANLVLLLDVSGSMNAPNKLPLVVRSMEMLLDGLKPTDTVGIVVYAGEAGTVLEPTPVRNKERIVEALRSLTPGGSTAGAAGIERAYDLAEANFRKGGVNRILLATDGDFNVGVSGTEALKGLVERKREKGVYLSVLGFGQGNYRDELAQALAQNGNGVAAYIDTENEARKVLVQQASGSLFTIARDVKLQVEFNPATVSEYRLVGYETRALRREDFNNDAVDAGDVGAGHTVTAIYEITPVGARPSVDEARYPGNGNERKKSDEEDKPMRGSRDEYGFLKIRYKLPGEEQSRLLDEAIPLRSANQSAAVSRDVAFSTAVAGFAQLLRGGSHTGALRYGDVIRQAQAAKGEDPNGYRAEFIELARKVERIRD